MMFAAKPQNDVVPCGHKHKNKSKSFDLLLFLELMVGIEPTACSLRVSCSAIEPHQHYTLMFIILKNEHKVNKYLTIRAL